MRQCFTERLLELDVVYHQYNSNISIKNCRNTNFNQNLNTCFFIRPFQKSPSLWKYSYIQIRILGHIWTTEFCSMIKWTTEDLWQSKARESFNAELSHNRLGKSLALRILYPEIPEPEQGTPRFFTFPQIHSHWLTLVLTYFDKGFINIKHSEMISFLHSKLSVLPGLEEDKCILKAVMFNDLSIKLVYFLVTIGILTIKNSSSTSTFYHTHILRWCS